MPGSSLLQWFSQNHGMVGPGRDLWRLSSPTPLQKRVHLEAALISAQQETIPFLPQEPSIAQKEVWVWDDTADESEPMLSLGSPCDLSWKAESEWCRGKRNQRMEKCRSANIFHHISTQRRHQQTTNKFNREKNCLQWWSIFKDKIYPRSSCELINNCKPVCKRRKT